MATRRLKCPEMLYILGKTWTVEDEEAHSEDEGPAMGTTHHHLCEIRLDRNCNDEQQKDTLLHEVIHAIEAELDLKMRERQVRLLATGLLAFLRENPKVTRWLIQQ